MSDRIDVNRLLLEMRAMKAQSQAFGNMAAQDVANPHNTQVNGPKFTDVMAQAVNKVNEVQQASSSMSTAYIQGDPNVGITDVMIASQKAGVAFDAMVQVRNKLVEAYKDVMNMPV
ncbi:flagellar hook-basal body complex protein FliE [Teredinibacter sp. KSP-S5-2]|uniref:flagellar hook-basal body complex protein FliE n=1 Tax=Teredinibacter sp. KSP-S5-2 TaxID=3034506 RepID=UPI002934B404|nr:flagellar hook-basal body complex protein FliE [Teredinibacter sp. KSP-S5-2]WNO07923.1 flagellar hook-basal body complex protein FliE [Teredinibacter sp. KSP-S5-2]